jgi:hypothetical protein
MSYRAQKQRSRQGRWVADVGDDLLLREELDATFHCDIAGIATVDGDVGLGKTEAVRQWASEQPVPTLYVQIDENEHHSVNVDDLLYRERHRTGAVDLAEVNRLRRPVDRRHLLTELLAAEERIIITDEAGTASRATFTRLRTMSDRHDARWTWIVVGTGCVERMRRLGLTPCGNRLIGDYTAEGLVGTDLTQYLAAYHPAYEDDSLAELINIIDIGLAERRPGGRGNRRSWDTFTYRLERLTGGGPTVLTAENADLILGAMKPWEPDEDRR